MGSTNNSLQRWHSPTWTDADLSASVAGEPTEISGKDNVGVQIVIGAGATGEFFIQGAIAYDDTLRSPGPNDWVVIPVYDGAGNAVALTTSGSAGQYLCNLNQLAFTWLRVIYTRTSGTGTANVWVSAKHI